MTRDLLDARMTEVVGALNEGDVLAAYDRALTKRLESMGLTTPVPAVPATRARAPRAKLKAAAPAPVRAPRAAKTAKAKAPKVAKAAKAPKLAAAPKRNAKAPTVARAGVKPAEDAATLAKRAQRTEYQRRHRAKLKASQNGGTVTAITDAVASAVEAPVAPAVSSPAVAAAIESTSNGKPHVVARIDVPHPEHVMI